MWGLTCGDFADIVTGFTHMTRSVVKKEAIQHSVSYDYYAERVGLLPLNNATSIPFDKTIIASTEIPESKATTVEGKIVVQQNLTCDGRSLYMLCDNKILHRINLDDTFTDNKARFSKFDTQLSQKEQENISVVSANGYLFLIGPELHQPKVFKLHPFKAESGIKYEIPSSFWTSPRLSSPAVSDGEYIYCFHSSKKIAVWMVKSGSVIYQREIELHQNGTQLLPPFDKKVSSSKWSSTTVQYVSGNIYTFLICLQKGETQKSDGFRYFARSFSLVNGRHICDSVFTLKFPVLCVTSDPWNSCMWAVTPTPTGLSLIKTHMFGSKPQWLTGVPLSIMPTIEKVKEAFLGDRSLKGASVAGSLFIEYISTMFAGTEQRAALNSENYSTDMSNFVCPCTEKMVVSIIEALQFFRQVYIKPEKTNPISFGNIQKVVVSLLALLQVNLSNIYSRRMMDTLSPMTLNTICAMLVDFFDNSQFEFAFKTVAYVFITAMPLIFQGQNARCASIFKRILEKTTPDFIYTALHYIQSYRFFTQCFTASSCRDTFGPLLDQLIKNPNGLQQTQKDLLSLFQRNLMIEMRTMYDENPGDLPLEQDQLQATFFSYSKLITEKFIVYLNSTENLQEEVVKDCRFVIFFRKWLLLLQPITKYSRVSKELVSALHPLFLLLAEKVQTTNISGCLSKDRKSFLVIYSLFFEVFLIFIEFIMALLEGGNELDNTQNYLWLVRSVLDSNINNDNFETISKKLLNPKTTPEERRKILSLGIEHSKESIDVLDAIFDPERAEEINQLVDVFYFKQYIKNFKKSNSKRMKLNDILTVFALSKQFGVLPELGQIMEKLRRGEQPNFSYRMKGIQTIVNEGRRAQIKMKQKTASVKEKQQKDNPSSNGTSDGSTKRARFEQSVFDSPRRPQIMHSSSGLFTIGSMPSKISPRSSMHQVPELTPQTLVDKYLEGFKQKLIFLLVIRPCYCGKMVDDSQFKHQVKILSHFITEEIRIERCLELVKSVEKVKQNIYLGMNSISEIIDHGFDQSIVCFLLDKIVKSENFIRYLTCVQTIEKETTDSIEFNSVCKLLALLLKMITKSTSQELINLLVVLYSHLMLAIGSVELHSIFGPLSNIMKILLNNPPNINSEYIPSYIALVCSAMYACIMDSKAVPKPEDLEHVARLIFPRNKIELNRLPVAYLCISCGMSLPFTDDVLLHFIRTCDPSSYHNVFQFAKEYISQSPDKTHLIHSFLSEISSVASGGKPKFLQGHTPVALNTRHKAKRVQTPGVFFIGCSGMIHVIRHCLTVECPAKKQITDIFKFILDYSVSNRTLAVPKGMEMFTPRKFLFGVFAVLSNTIGIPRSNALIKNTITSNTYYVTRVDSVNGCYYGWKIPITAKSAEERIQFSYHIAAKTSLPFQPSLFPDYSHLMPFFRSAFADKPQSYIRESLVFYVLACLSEYCSDPEFLAKLFDSGITFELTKFDVHNYKKDFVDILRVHLSTISNGFWVPPSTSPRLSFCSMAGIYDRESGSVLDNNIVITRGAQSFVSDPLDPLSTTYLHIEFHAPMEFEIGMHFFSLHASTSETYMLNSDGIALYNGCDVETIEDSITFTTMTLSYDPINHKLTIYDGSVRIFTYNTPKAVGSFILHTFGPADITYSLSNSSPDSIPMNFATQPNICPAAGKTVFSLRKMRKKESLEQALKAPVFIQTHAQPTEPQKPSFQTLSEQRNEFIFDWDEKPTPIVSYPASIIKACGHTLNVKAASKIRQEILNFPSAHLNHTSNAGTLSKTPICTKLISEGKNCVSIIPLCVAPLFIDDNSGEVTEFIETEENTRTIHTFQPLHPSTYPLLPAEILNFFATGFVNEIRRDSQSQIFLHALTQPNIGVKKALEVFRLDLPQLVEYVLTLILHIEPIDVSHIENNECPIDFTTSVISKSHHISGPNYIYKQALDEIFAYLNEAHLATEVAKIWNHLMAQKFSDCGLHFVQRGQPHAIVSQLVSIYEPREIYEARALGFLVFRAGFNGQGSIRIKQGDKYTEFSKGLLYVSGNSITLMHGDAEGDGVVALPVLQGSNETYFGSFFELVTVMKYLSLFVNNNSFKITRDVIKDVKSHIYLMFIDSFIVQSPFFSRFAGHVLEFLCTCIPLQDLDSELVLRVSVLAIYTDKEEDPVIQQFLFDQETMWNERKFFYLKKFFPEFCDDDEHCQVSRVKETEWSVPDIRFPSSLATSDNCIEFSAQLLRLMRQRRRLASFPFHLILRQWSVYAMTLPSYTVTKIGKYEFSVHVTTKCVDEVRLVGTKFFNMYAKMKLRDSDEYASVSKYASFSLSECSSTFFLKYDGFREDSTFKQIHFFVKSYSSVATDADLRDFIIANREMFLSDTSILFYNFDETVNTQIVELIDSKLFTCDSLSLEIQDNLLLASDAINIPKHLIAFRSTLLLATNWMLYHNRFHGPVQSIRHMSHFMPKQLKMKCMKQLIESRSTTDTFSFTIDRTAAMYVRDGTSTDLSRTFISQLAAHYRVPRYFRKSGANPFKVRFSNEPGTDAGGLVREFILESVTDITLQTTGLFVPVPNAQNKDEQNWDTFIPIPCSELRKKAHNLYKVIGVLLGVCMRSQIVKDIPFPPFIWEFLATGNLKIEDIFSIDRSYKDLIMSLEQAIEMKMSESAFRERFCLAFVAHDSLGSEIALTELGRTKPVTIANCREYISLSNDFRLSEIRENLECMREGLWENLDLKPPMFINGELIHSYCCGDTLLTCDDLLAKTEFNNVPASVVKQLETVLRSFTPEQLTKFLKFCTAREKLPTQQTDAKVLKVDYAKSIVDKCPTASTCYNTFTMPHYSSYEIARDLILKAITYTASFENK